MGTARRLDCGRAILLAGGCLLFGGTVQGFDSEGSALPRPGQADPDLGVRYIEHGAPGQEFAPSEIYFESLRADSLLRVGALAEAGAILEELLAQLPESGRLWSRLAYCRYADRTPELSIEPYQRLIEFGYGPAPNVAVSVSYYNLACALALSGSRTEAFKALERALKDRFEDRGLLLADPDLDSLRDDPRFSRLAGEGSASGTPRAEGWRKDLDLLTREIERLHAGFDGTFAPGFLARIGALKSQVSRLENEELLAELQRGMVLLGDGHSNVSSLPTDRVKTTQLPMDLYWFPDGIRIVSATGPLSDAIGGRLTRIGRGRASEFAEDIASFVSRDNPMGVVWIGPVYLTLPHILVNLGYITDSKRVPIGWVDGSGVERILEVEAGSFRGGGHLVPPATLSPPSRPLYMRSPEEPFWLETVDVGVVYLQFNQVRDGVEETLSDFSDRLRVYLEINDVHSLIIDVRQNSGGDTHLYLDLLRTLIHFSVSDSRNEIFLITGRRTFSAAQNFVTDVERLASPILVGEPTGSRPNFIGESTRVELPFTGVRATVSSRYHQHSDPTDTRIWIEPHVPAVLSWMDYLVGRDPAFDAILEIIDRR